MQGDVRIEPAELAEALSELDHHDRIVLLDELLGKVQGKGGLAAAGSGYDHPVTGIDPLFAASQMSFLRGTWYILSCT